MTKYLRLSPLARWAQQLFGVKSGQFELEQDRTPARERIFLLDRLLQVDAQRRSGCEVKLFSGEMSTRSLLFKSSTNFNLGEVLKVKLLLRHGSLDLQGTVQWVHQGAQGFSGQIKLEVTPEQEAEIHAFLKLRQKNPDRT